MHHFVSIHPVKSTMINGTSLEWECINNYFAKKFPAQTYPNIMIEFSDRQMPICLPPPHPRIDRVLTVAGWGRSYVFNESGPMIHEIPMIIDPKCLRPRSDKLPYDAADYLCATSLNTNDYFAPRTCHGDSGAGMEQIDERGRSVLIALTSFGTKGCPANELARFTRVNHYLQPICTYTGVCYSYDNEDD
ncbi:hypothetical protein Y032_0029g1955 [Ancylostoma ceylanicum]|nr:hypothetical protein Y032_0029g1955 [Ancylostoma ceylanicum]